MSQKLIVGPAILSYPNLFEARGYNGGTAKYSASLVFPKGSDLKALKAAVVAVAKERFGDKAKQILASNPPIHNEEKAEAKGYPEGSVYFNAKSTRQPQIVSRYADPKTGKPVVIEEDAATEPEGPNEMYPGVLVKAYVSVYAYDTSGNRGVAFGLEGLQRWDEGERLDGRRAAVNVFDAEMPDEADIADLDGDEDTDGIDDIL